MSGKSSETTSGWETFSQDSGPEDWMRYQGQGLYDQAAKATENYKGYEGERVANYGQDWGKAADMIRGMSGPNADFTQARQTLTDLLGAEGNKLGGVESYVNPHVQGVLAPTLRGLNEARQITNNNVGAEATMSGAYGDARHGVAQSLTNRDYTNAVSDVTSKVYSDAWDKGQAQQNTVLGRMAQMPGMFASLGAAEDGRTLTNASALNAISKEEQQLNQAKANVDYVDFVEQRDHTKNRSAQLIDMLNAVPHNTHTEGRKDFYSKKEKEDNSGLQAIASMATKGLSSIFGGGGMGSTLLGALL